MAHYEPAPDTEQFAKVPFHINFLSSRISLIQKHLRHAYSGELTIPLQLPC